MKRLADCQPLSYLQKTFSMKNHSYFIALALLFWCLFPFQGTTQVPPIKTASDIELSIKRLGFLGSALYVAAHPDDENTRLIAYLSKERLARTAYLSITRGDGGQNLIGPEIREKLGMIRSHELMAARRIDGGQQFFTRANDFGYSKSVEETLEWWGKEEVTADMVDIIRYFKPDVIITRFPPDERAGHGHHTASAVLAHEAFLLAANTSYATDLSQPMWQAKRLYMNTGRWWTPTVDESLKGILKVDVGGYNALLGESYPEIAARARTQHKSQGFGSTGARGEQLEYLEYVAGDTAYHDIFEGIDTSWKRLPGGAKIHQTWLQVVGEFRSTRPGDSVVGLLKLRKMIYDLPEGYWREVKLAEIEAVIVDCLGLYLQARASAPSYTAGDKVDITLELIKRNEGISVKVGHHQNDYKDLITHQVMTLSSQQTIESHHSQSQPYWLQKEGSPGRYAYPDRTYLVKPVDLALLTETLTLTLGEETTFTLNVPVVYTWNDPVDGESWRPVEILPEVSLNLTERNLIFTGPTPQTLEVVVKNHKAQVEGAVKPWVPSGWKVTPSSAPIKLGQKDSEQRLFFQVIPPKDASAGTLGFEAILSQSTSNKGYERVQYGHIPTLTYLPKAEARLVKIDLKTVRSKIGYIQGAGDAIPDALRVIGLEIDEINGEVLTLEKLKKYDAIILGIRALNVRENIRNEMPVLLRYVEQGGTLIVQYNTTFDTKGLDIAPYPLRISRERVSEEDAPMTILQPGHRALTFPNRISQADFDGWVQERGLYFPNQWGPEFTALLASADTGEPAREGGLLVAPYGKGYYVYTGYAWFRQLPAGVPGAYRLFVNLISLGKNK
jgi:LmbE family N-acetylglucosaminyl deacetylase